MYIPEPICFFSEMQLKYWQEGNRPGKAQSGHCWTWTGETWILILGLLKLSWGVTWLG